MSEQARRIRWNSFYAFLSQLIRLLTNLLLFVGVARYYGAEVFGQFTTAHSLATIFLLFADFGFDSLLVTEIARHRDRAADLTKKYFSIKCIFALVSSVVLLLVPLIVTYSSQTSILIEIFAVYVLFSSLNNFFFALFKGLEEFHHETRISFWTSIVLLAVLILFGIYGVSILFVALAFVIVRCAGFVASGVIAKRFVRARIFSSVSLRTITSWNDILVFGFYVVFGNLYFLFDTVLISFLKGDREVGLYQSVFKLVLIAMILQDIATTSMLPVLSRLHVSDVRKWEEMGKLLNKTLLFIALPIVAVFAVLPEKLIQLVYGPTGFSEAAPILRMFSVVVLFRYLAETYGLMLTTSLRHPLRLKVVILATVVNVVSNLVLLPQFGILGTAWAAVITNFVVFISYALASHQPFAKWIFELRNVAMMVVIGALCALLVNVGISIILLASVSLVAYSAAIVFIGYSKGERFMIFRIRRESLIVQSTGM